MVNYHGDQTAEIIDIRFCTFTHSHDDLASIPHSQLEPKGIHQPPLLFINIWECIDQDEVSIGPFDRRTQVVVDLSDLTGLSVSPIVILNKVGKCWPD